VTLSGISIFRFDGDRIVEEWTEFDGIGLLHQLGVMAD
jgi:predicted ester cyclase